MYACVCTVRSCINVIDKVQRQSIVDPAPDFDELAVHHRVCTRLARTVLIINTPNMTVYLVISLPKYCVYTIYIGFWPTLHMQNLQ